MRINFKLNGPKGRIPAISCNRYMAYDTNPIIRTHFSLFDIKALVAVKILTVTYTMYSYSCTQMHHPKYEHK